MKKHNPRELVPWSTLDKERRKIKDEAVNYAFVVMFSVMHDKHGWGFIRLNRLFNQISYVADSITRGYVKLEDMAQWLDENMGIKFVE